MQELFSTALQLGQEEVAFQYLQKAKSRTFNDLLNRAVSARKHSSTISKTSETSQLI